MSKAILLFLSLFLFVSPVFAASWQDKAKNFTPLSDAQLLSPKTWKIDLSGSVPILILDERFPNTLISRFSASRLATLYWLEILPGQQYVLHSQMKFPP